MHELQIVTYCTIVSVAILGLLYGELTLLHKR